MNKKTGKALHRLQQWRYYMIALLLPLMLLRQLSVAQRVNDDAYREATVFTAYTKDSLPVDVALLYDSAGEPVYYKAHLMTGVCSDTLCRPVNIVIYWDLLGYFADYKTPEDEPLTKLDHVEFTAADHQLLHKILADTNSLLRDYLAEDMVDHSLKVHSLKVDGITGATSKTFDGAIVSGAAYTVHTLWHFVNGSTAKQINAHTRTLLDDHLVKQMLHSGNAGYQRFLLSTLTDVRAAGFIQDIIALIESKDQYVPHFAIARLPEHIWEDSIAQRAILSCFGNTATTVQSSLLEKFSGRELHADGLKILVDNIHKLNRSQAEKVFKILTYNRPVIDVSLTRQIAALCNDATAHVAQQAQELLRSIKRQRGK